MTQEQTTQEVGTELEIATPITNVLVTQKVGKREFPHEIPADATPEFFAKNNLAPVVASRFFTALNPEATNKERKVFTQAVQKAKSIVGRLTLASCEEDPDLQIRQQVPKKNRKGEIIGYDIQFRKDKEAEKRATKIHERAQAIASVTDFTMEEATKLVKEKVEQGKIQL